VDYLSGLAQQLTQEQSALQGTLESMNKNVSRMRAIIQMQQTYATSPVMPEECELDELLDDALRLHQGALERAGIQVTREVKPLPRVKVDRYKVLQILFNLLSNSCHALESKPSGDRRLEIRLEERGGWARIQVVDSGEGIAPEVKPRLFNQGFTTREDGQGIGLHSSSLAAQLLGGRLTLESEGRDKGATATLEFPVAPPQAPLAHAS
jgi:signal transduction histidine kinase